MLWYPIFHTLNKVVGLDFAGDMLYDAEKRQKQQEVLGLPQFHTPMQ